MCGSGHITGYEQGLLAQSRGAQGDIDRIRALVDYEFEVEGISRVGGNSSISDGRKSAILDEIGNDSRVGVKVDRVLNFRLRKFSRDGRCRLIDV